MGDLIDKIQRQLDANHYVEWEDIQTLLDAQKWISVEDRLPEEDELVWVYQPSNAWKTKKQRCVRVDLNDYLWEKKLFTHWKPLPEPPTV